MKCLFALSLCLCAATALAEEPAKTSFTVPGGATFKVTAPEGWKLLKIQPDPTLRPTILLEAPKHEAKIQMYFFVDRVGELGSKSLLQDSVTQRAREQYLLGSKNKEVTLQTLDVPGASCIYTQIDGAGLEGKKQKLGDFSVVATGIMKWGDSVGVITLLGNSFDSPAFKTGKDFFKTGIAIQQ
jgi:hypothetical protein